ncbi:hypothetical protein BKA62DRAFT_623785 [Auriculariales sp. MPI-PUGE-AT-0066]|nr:hypothetical protein BKA62DRAFT_623785 [Auriculariales sp. MPI-PUGE-AT-0066]
MAKGVPASVQRLRSYGPSTSSATGTHNDLPQGSPPDCTQFISSIAPAGKESALYLVEDDVRSARYPSRSTEFEEKYPPDRYGEEAAPNARVWRVYRDRVTDLDEDLVKGWNATLDVLLIFAGLFSAVATAFIIEAYVSKQLQHDYLQYTAIGVLAVLAELNTTVTAPQSLPDLNKVKSTTRAGWVNGLWFTSLILALIDALLAILVKQWLVEYESRMRQPAAMRDDGHGDTSRSARDLVNGGLGASSLLSLRYYTWRSFFSSLASSPFCSICTLSYGPSVSS